MTETVAAIVWFLGIVLWFVIRLPYQRRASRIGVAVRQRTLADGMALAASGVGLVAVPAFYLVTGIPEFADYPFRPLLGWIGLLLQFLFLLLFHASHRQLGRNWSVTLEIRDGHRLVTDGLYRYVRHPMYSSFWLWAAAQAFLIPNWVAGLSGLVGVGVLFFVRIRAEEAMMLEFFGDEYRAYASRTGCVIPSIFRDSR